MLKIIMSVNYKQYIGSAIGISFICIHQYRISVLTKKPISVHLYKEVAVIGRLQVEKCVSLFVQA